MLGIVLKGLMIGAQIAGGSGLSKKEKVLATVPVVLDQLGITQKGLTAADLKRPEVQAFLSKWIDHGKAGMKLEAEGKLLGIEM